MSAFFSLVTFSCRVLKPPFCLTIHCSLLMNSIIVPSNMILNKLGKPSIYLPACMVVWGVISTATAATTSFRGLLVCRFFLGFVEAAYFVSIVPYHKLNLSPCTNISTSPVVSTFCRHGTQEKNPSKEPLFCTPDPYYQVHFPV